ncbi:MAG: helix-turn-helix transcriptional regulator [Oscillospiraceae bacterium]|nr:helix-turn-helix transcriptional regulator [Oscillospiraceae bacterium]
MTFGERIKLIRKENKLTQTEFAKKLHVGPGSISRLESGENNPSDRTIALICREFGIREEWLHTGEGDMYAPETTFNLAEYIKSKDASELELRIVKAYFTLPKEVRHAVMESLSEAFRDVLSAPPEGEEIHT